MRLDDIAICIKTHERPTIAQRCVDSVLQHYPAAHVYVCDDSKAPIEYRGATTIVADYDVGLSAGRNILVQRTDERLVFILDDDFVFTRRTDLSAFWRALDELPDVGVAGGSYRVQQRRNWFAGELDLTAGTLAMRPPEGIPDRLSDGTRYHRVDFTPNFFLARRAALEETVWDEELKLAEHVEFFLRFKESKWGVVLLPDADARHDRYASGTYTSQRRRASRFAQVRKQKIGEKRIDKRLWREYPYGPREVDFLATESHYADHLRPIYAALGSDAGTFTDHHKRLNNADRLCVVASACDVNAVRGVGYHRIVLAQHGAGQTYEGVDNPSYAGYPDRPDVVGFLHPGPYSAQADREVHPHLPVYEIGVPRLDEWHTGKKKLPRGSPVACISFHWECRLCPETRSAICHYADDLAFIKDELDRNGINLIGHAHPRIQDSGGRAAFEKAGIEFVEDFEEVLDRSHVYCVDNSSTLFEFAAAAPEGDSRPVVVLNAPWYRRDVEHGLRFWRAARIGLRVDEPDEVAGVICTMIETGGRYSMREEVLSEVYAYRDGHAARRAAAAIREIRDTTPRRRGRIAKPQIRRFSMERMEALATFRNRKYFSGIVHIGDEIEVPEHYAEALEKRSLARRISEDLDSAGTERDIGALEEKHTKMQLLDMAREMDIVGRSRMNKRELAEAVASHA